MLTTKLSRRSFINISVGSLIGLNINLPVEALATGLKQAPALRKKTFLPPLFCIANITPNAPGQGGQETMVARYPLAIVPQDTGADFKRWRDKIKSLNPEIVLLGYQVVIQETKVPGPGHDRLNKVKNSFVKYPWGGVATVPGAFPGDMTRVFDPRTKEWRTGFLDACNDTLNSYPYEGLFLDQCTVFARANPIPSIRNEMLSALQEALLELRKAHPNAIIVGNSSYNFVGLNGELNEGRHNDIVSELAVFAGHVNPRVDMYQTVLKQAGDIATVKREMAMTHAQGGFYGACVDGQHVLWFDIFDDVIASYKKS